tara:strand:+ start:240 stop:1487 length:1248 start_codon:yes stop_codon:yes gene_type:complete
MKISKSQLKAILKEEISAALYENYNEMTDEDYEILDIGPSHSRYAAIARKAERLEGGLGAGPGSSKTQYDWRDAESSRQRLKISTNFIKQIETERGRAAIAEPMIALGMDPSDTLDRGKYKDMLSCGMSLQGHLDKIIDREHKDIYSDLDSDRSAHDWSGELGKRCGKYDEKNGRYTDMSMDCVSFRMRRGGKIGQTSYGSEHLYDRVRLYNKIMGGGGLGSAQARKCAAFDPTLLQKALKVQAEELESMPAYHKGGKELKENKMKITRKQLKAILVEEIEKALAEGHGDVGMHDFGAEIAKRKLRAAEAVYEKWQPTTPEGEQYQRELGDALQMRGVHMKEEKDENWAQDAAEDIEEKGTEGEFTKYCGGDVTQACVDKAASGSSTKRKRQAAFAANVNSSDSLVYPKGKGKKD